MSDATLSVPIPVPRSVPVVLSFVAGYVDACTYLALFGVFVAQVTGSFVLAGTQFFRPEAGALAKSLAIPFFFASGFAITILMDWLAEHPRVALASSMAIECLLLIGFLTTGVLAEPLPGPDAPGAIAALMFGMMAMGVQSALVRLLMRGTPSTNVMTTNTTQLAIDAAEVVLGLIERRRAGRGVISDKRYTQARQGVRAFLPIALGFLCGTVSGAAAYTQLGLACVLVAILLLATLVVWAARA